MATERFYYNPETGHYDLTHQQWEKLKAQESKKSKKYDLEFALMGNGYPSKSISMENKQKKALQKNPTHTTMRDYKPSNPDSVVSKARQKNRKHLQSKGLKIKKQVTEK